MSEQLLGNKKHGLVFVLSAPAGTGKTTLVRMLMEEFPCVVQSISFTTRPPREVEKEGKDYYFISRSEFEKKIRANEFLEYVNLYGDYYGTSLAWVNARLNEGKHVIMVIDAQGGLQLLGKYPATFIFLKPPSMEALRARLIKRKTETPESLEKRLAWSVKEMEVAKHYHFQIVNEDLSVAYQVLRSILIAEEHKT